MMWERNNYSAPILPSTHPLHCRYWCFLVCVCVPRAQLRTQRTRISSRDWGRQQRVWGWPPMLLLRTPSRRSWLTDWRSVTQTPDESESVYWVHDKTLGHVHVKVNRLQKRPFKPGWVNFPPLSPECCQAGRSCSHSDHCCCSKRSRLQQEHGCSSAAGAELQGETQPGHFSRRSVNITQNKWIINLYIITMTRHRFFCCVFLFWSDTCSCASWVGQFDSGDCVTGSTEDCVSLSVCLVRVCRQWQTTFHSWCRGCVAVRPIPKTSALS